MAEKKTGASKRPTKETREAVMKRIAVAQEDDMSFKDFFTELADDEPSLKEATVYGWWQAALKSAEPTKPASGKPGKTSVNVSERLATLLRKEGMLEKRAEEAKKELVAVRKEVEELWAKRSKAGE